MILSLTEMDKRVCGFAAAQCGKAAPFRHATFLFLGEATPRLSEAEA
jgi:hypothetical protein